MAQRTWFITGASSGIGHEIALSALERGDTVVATARDPSSLNDLAQKGCLTTSLDLTHSASQIHQVVQSVLTKVPQIDILVNAAGYLLEGCIEETSDRELLTLYTTNLLGPLRLTTAILPSMRTHHTGTIATIAGIGALSGAPAAGLFCSTKAALTTATEALRAEVSPLGIQVCLIQLGHFRTRFLNYPGHRAKAELRLSDYENVRGEVGKFIDGFDSNQPGDAREAARVVVEVLTRSGRARGREVPGYLALGSDVGEAEERARAVRDEDMKKWADLRGVTDVKS